MVEVRFDPSESVHFDLARGRVALDTEEPRLLIPPSALMTLCQSVDEDALRDFGRLIGTEAGRRLAERLGRALDSMSVHGLLEHLGGDLGLIGLGSLGLERWGRALVLTLDESPFGAPGDALIASVLEGALQRALVRTVSVVPLQREQDRARYLIVNADAALRVRAWLAEGVAWGDVLTKLNGNARDNA
jgi:hypothetical protein